MPDGPLVVVAGTSFQSLATEREVLAACGAAVVDLSGRPRAEVLATAAQADALMVDYFACDAETIAILERCRVIVQYGIGLDGIDIDAASRAGILVCHTPTYCLDELADHAFALLLALARRLPRFDRGVRAGRWDYNDGMPLRRLSGATLGLVGFGRVGQGVARRARAFGLHIVAVDPAVADLVFAEHGVERLELDGVFRRADLVSIHAALVPATRHLVGAEQLALLRPGAILVNTSRGAVVDSSALRAALEAGRLGGVGLDVLEQEPPDPDDPILAHGDALVTPHAGFLSVESMADLHRQAAEDVRRVLDGEEPVHCVNIATATPGRKGTQ